MQLLTKAFGIYAVIKDEKNLIKLIGRGLMVGFAFINMIQMFYIGLYFQYLMIQMKSKSFVDSVIYILLLLIIIQLILYSFCHNINTMTKSLYLSLDRKLKIFLMASQGLIIILNIVIKSLMFALIAELNKNTNDSGDANSKYFLRTCL